MFSVKSITRTFALAFTTTLAFALPAAAQQRPFNWTGFYIGGHVGGVRSQTNNNGWVPGCSTDPTNFRCFG